MLNTRACKIRKTLLDPLYVKNITNSPTRAMKHKMFLKNFDIIEKQTNYLRHVRIILIRNMQENVTILIRKIITIENIYMEMWCGMIKNKSM